MNRIPRRDLLKNGAAALAASAITSTLSGCRALSAKRAAERKSGMRFIHATDTHLDLGKPDTVKWMEMLVEKINREYGSLDFVLFGGDNFNNNVQGKDDAIKFKQIIDKLHCPTYLVRGNKESTPKPASDPLDQPGFAKMFFSNDFEVHGRDWKLMNGDYAILGIDTTIEQQGNGMFSQQSLSFIEDELKNNPSTSYIVLNHQVYDNFWKGDDEKDIHKYVLNNADVAKKRLFNYPNLLMTLSGHKHLDSVTKQQCTTVIATLGFVVPQDPDNLNDHQMRYVEITGARIKEKLVSIV